MRLNRLLRLEEGPGLAVPEALVGAARPAELGVGAVLHYDAVLQHHDAVERRDGGEDPSLGCRVKSTEGSFEGPDLE